MADILAVKDLAVVLDGVRVLDDVGFSLARGEHLAVIGPNGSGKTVLLRALIGVVPHRGEIRWTPPCPRIGYVPQKIDADRHLPLSGTNLLESKRSILKLAQARVDETLAQVGLERHALKTPVGHLSGGQFQKLLLAFALMGDPDVLLLDEPTASIDEPGELEIYALLDRLGRERGLTILIASHDLDMVFRHASKVLCLKGRSVCFGAPAEVLTESMLAQIYRVPARFVSHREHPHEVESGGRKS